MATYSLSIVGVLVLCLLSILLAIHSGSSKGRAGALSGPVLPADDDNLLYRIDRVHMNAVEALPPFVVPAVLAMMVGVGPVALATLVWGYIAIRLIHVAVYLRGGKAAKGGSVRTILYVSGALVTIILIATTAVAALQATN
ncbi:MAPEG family protein [Bradyrhizobium diazoefficiens]|uniref:MAPEG family protein n=1 Tax=Bradyrhizobium diazoefficiens TaxID=1355477 RepID=UPI00190A63C2|nr:MAPEG family protein [Bradyrhizobium diazoefficiens]QQO12551.1 MAPEG family protein [Bradyrhizobium diazoefficiens]